MDDIQQKLNLIDKEISGKGFHTEIIAKSPLLFPIVGFILGITIQNTVKITVWLWLFLVFVFTVLALVESIYYYKNPSNSVSRRLIYLSLLCFMSFGTVRLTVFYHSSSNDIRNLISEQRTIATIKGTILTEPRLSSYPLWYFEKFTPKTTNTSFYLDTNEIQTTTGWSKITGRIRVQVSEPIYDLIEGDYIKIYCWLEKLESQTNPGQFDFAKYLKNKNVYLSASLKSRISIEVIEKANPTLFNKIQNFIKKTATSGLLEDFEAQHPGNGLLEALLLGTRSNIDSKTYIAFQKTGLLHFISLSGMHLGIFVGAVWWLCKIIGLTKRPAAFVCLFALTLFLLIVPPRPPTIRAAIICLFFCLAAIFRKQGEPINTLCIAAFVLLLFNPPDLFTPQWQLSFTAVAGILFFEKKIKKFLISLLSIISNRFNKLIDTLLEMFSVGIAAWIGSAGILLYHFYVITPVASLWTVLMSPFIILILICGYLKIVLSFLLPTICFFMTAVLSGLCNLLVNIVVYIADLNISGILIGKVSILVIIIYYAIVVYANYFHSQKPLLKKIVIITIFLFLISWFAVAKWQRSHRDNISLTVLNVGHGQAILLQFPPNKNILFDCGSLTISDVGNRICVSYLKYNGISRIDSIMISHNDIDHINGIPEVVQSCNVNSVYTGNIFFQEKEDRNQVKYLNSFFEDNAIDVKRLNKEFIKDKDFSMNILWGTDNLQDNLGNNDQSLVTLIEFGKRKILLCSDIEKFAQQQIMKKYPALKADVVVVPHHGSKVTTEQKFLKQLNAEFLIASCSSARKSSLINPGYDTNFLSTSENHSVTLIIDNDGTITIDK